MSTMRTDSDDSVEVFTVGGHAVVTDVVLVLKNLNSMFEVP